MPKIKRKILLGVIAVGGSMPHGYLPALNERGLWLSLGINLLVFLYVNGGIDFYFLLFVHRIRGSTQEVNNTI